MTDAKPCEGCGGQICRRKGISRRQWGKQRFCSISCAKRSAPWSSPLERFWENVFPEPMSGCWLWAGSWNSDDYGQIMVNREYHRAHVLSFVIHFGQVAPGLMVLHRCDVPPCVNPGHLYAGTNIDNMRDMVSRGRVRRGKRNHATKLSEDLVREIRGSKIPNRELGALLGVSRTTIYQIRTRSNWAWVE